MTDITCIYCKGELKGVENEKDTYKCVKCGCLHAIFTEAGLIKEADRDDNILQRIKRRIYGK